MIEGIRLGSAAGVPSAGREPKGMELAAKLSYLHNDINETLDLATVVQEKLLGQFKDDRVKPGPDVNVSAEGILSVTSHGIDMACKKIHMINEILSRINSEI